MLELSLFTGAGGGLLGTTLLSGLTTMGYVEIDDHCQRVIKQRIADRLADWPPIFGDIRTFLSEGYAGSYQGMVDVVTGGDPCQDNSCAAPNGSPRESLGAEFVEVVRIVGPRFVIRENPATVRKDAPYPADRFIDELEPLGYTATPVQIGSCCLGGDHARKRLFVLAEQTTPTNPDRESDLETIAKVLSLRAQARQARQDAGRGFGRNISPIPWALSEAGLLRTVDELAGRVERCRAVGNGQDPRVVAAAWRLLTDDNAH